MRPSAKKHFIFEQPNSMPAREVARAAQRAGLSLTVGYVYIVRGKGVARREQPQRPTDNSPTPRTSSEQRFIASAIELGLGRATELLHALRYRIHNL